MSGKARKSGSQDGNPAGANLEAAAISSDGDRPSFEGANSMEYLTKLVMDMDRKVTASEERLRNEALEFNMEAAKRNTDNDAKFDHIIEALTNISRLVEKLDREPKEDRTPRKPKTTPSKTPRTFWFDPVGVSSVEEDVVDLAVDFESVNDPSTDVFGPSGNPFFKKGRPSVIDGLDAIRKKAKETDNVQYH